MLDLVIPFTEDNSTALNDSLQRQGLELDQESRTSEITTISDDNPGPLNRGLFFLSFVVLTGLAVALILVLKFIRQYRENRRAAREDQLRTVTWLEGDSETEQVQALVAQ